MGVTAMVLFNPPQVGRPFEGSPAEVAWRLLEQLPAESQANLLLGLVERIRTHLAAREAADRVFGTSMSDEARRERERVIALVGHLSRSVAESEAPLVGESYARQLLRRWRRELDVLVWVVASGGAVRDLERELSALPVEKAW